MLGHLDFNILSTMKLNGFVRNDIVTDTWIRAYAAPFPTPQQSVGAIGWAKGFVTGAHQFEAPDANAKREILKKPAMAIWGALDRTLHADHLLPLFTELFPNARIHRLRGAGHYSPEDRPDTIADLISQFISRTV